MANYSIDFWNVLSQPQRTQHTYHANTCMCVMYVNCNQTHCGFLFHALVNRKKKEESHDRANCAMNFHHIRVGQRFSLENPLRIPIDLLHNGHRHHVEVKHWNVRPTMDSHLEWNINRAKQSSKKIKVNFLNSPIAGRVMNECLDHQYNIYCIYHVHVGNRSTTNAVHFHHCVAVSW